MKKVVLGLFAILLVTTLNAATLTWEAYGFLNGDSGNPLNYSNFDGAQAYLLLVTDVGTFAVSSSLGLTGATVIDSASLTDGTASGGLNGAETYLPLTQSYNLAVLFTTAGTDITLPTTGYYGVTPVVATASWNNSSGGSWIMDGTYTSPGVDVSLAVVPEPTSMALFAVGAGVLGLRRRFKNKKA